MNGTARKAVVYAATGLNTWVALYVWTWLAGLFAVVIGTFLIFISPNDPVPSPSAPAPWQPPPLPSD